MNIVGMTVTVDRVNKVAIIHRNILWKEYQ